MQNPHVSVIFPVYNGQRYLRKAIESVLGQTCSEFTLLICDDCSTDNSLEIIQSYADHRIKLLQNSVNRALFPNSLTILNIVEKFGIPQSHVRSFLLHGILSRLAHKLSQLLPIPSLEPFLSPLFSRWAAQNILKSHLGYDVIHVFSGVAEEILLNIKSTQSTSQTLTTVVRASSHIRVQKQLLAAEETRANCLAQTPVNIDQPSE
jgi:hypothetical protein